MGTSFQRCLPTEQQLQQQKFIMSKFGTFEITMNQADCDFTAIVYGKEAASYMLGKSMKATFTDLGKGRVAAHWFSSDPALAKFNFFGVFYEGDGHTINMPGFGGLVKYSSQSTADGYKTTMESEKYGKFDVVEVYCSQGVAKTITHKGTTHTEHWKRVINENGWYRMHHHENGLAMMMEDGTLTESQATKMLDGMKLHWNACDSGFQLIEDFAGEARVKSGGKYDEECDYVFPGEEPTKYIVTKKDAGKYLTIWKRPKDTTEVIFEFCGEGLMMDMKNLKSGTCAKLFYKKYTPLCGKMKVIASENVKEMMLAIGCPEKMACDYANDMATLEIEENFPVYRWNWQGKTPMDISMKLDEETEVFDPIMNEKMKAVCTKSGNKLLFTQKYSSMTFITTCTFTDNFMIMKTMAEGLKVPAGIQVLERCC